MILVMDEFFIFTVGEQYGFLKIDNEEAQQYNNLE